MKTIIFSLMLTMGAMIHSQTIVQEKVLWTGEVRGSFSKSLSYEIVDDEQLNFIDFTFVNLRYQTIRETQNVRFANLEQSLKFFNSIRQLFEGPYDPQDSRILVFGAWDKKLKVWRTQSMWGVKYCRINVGDDWCYLSEENLNEILITLNPDYFMPIP
jgi:hypothetical protein